MKRLFLLIIPLFGACAAHAPMSELVMFDKATIPDSVESVRIGLITYFEPGITSSYFEEYRDGDFTSYSDVLYPSITFQSIRLKDNGTARSLSLGRGLGVDWTRKINSDYYGTFAFSAPYSAKFSVQKVYVNERWVGFSGGIFTGVDTKRYIGDCRSSGVDCSIYPNKIALLFNSGLRSRFLFRDPRSPGLVITGAIEGGYIWNNSEAFLGFNISISSFE